MGTTNQERAVLFLAIALSGSVVSFAQEDTTIDVGRGPIPLHIPPSYDPQNPTPMVILLHGYSSSGAVQESYMQFTPLSDEFGFLYLFPDGTRDNLGNRFWNATDACCNFFSSPIDDSAYLRAVIDEMKLQYNVDERRVYFIGHSNGGFMSYRMACDHADAVAAIASLAGATFLDPADCTPAFPVHVLQIHGTNDTTVFYDGGCFQNCYPGAVESVEQWALADGCALIADDSAPPIDLDAGIPGPETLVTRYESECEPGGSGELWTIVGGGHVPALSADFTRLVIEYLYAHPKPGSDVAGDLNCDGAFDGADIDPFFLALGDPDAWAEQFPGCDLDNADMNGDGFVDGADIDAFFACLGGGECP